MAVPSGSVTQGLGFASELCFALLSPSDVGPLGLQRRTSLPGCITIELSSNHWKRNWVKTLKSSDPPDQNDPLNLAFPSCGHRQIAGSHRQPRGSADQWVTGSSIPQFPPLEAQGGHPTPHRRPLIPRCSRPGGPKETTQRQGRSPGAPA